MKRSTVLMLSLAILVVGSVSLRAQKQSPTVDCSVDGKHLTCDRAEFLKRFAEAHTIAVDSQPKDRLADAQLASFAKRLGKQVPPTLPSDLTLRLVRRSETGFGVGPGDVQLASLRIFASKDGADTSRLLWVETYRGQPDVPWLVVVRAITNQLQATLAGN